MPRTAPAGTTAVLAPIQVMWMTDERTRRRTRVHRTYLVLLVHDGQPGRWGLAGGWRVEGSDVPEAGQGGQGRRIWQPSGRQESREREGGREGKKGKVKMDGKLRGVEEQSGVTSSVAPSAFDAPGAGGARREAAPSDRGYSGRFARCCSWARRCQQHKKGVVVVASGCMHVSKQ